MVSEVWSLISESRQYNHSTAMMTSAKLVQTRRKQLFFFKEKKNVKRIEVTSCSLTWSSDFLLLNHELRDYVLSFHCEYSKVLFYDSRLTETSWYVLTSPQYSGYNANKDIKDYQSAVHRDIKTTKKCLCKRMKSGHSWISKIYGI